MSGNYRHSQQQEQYYQEGFYPGQEHMGTVYYQQPQYVNPQQFQHQMQMPQQMFYQQPHQPYYNQGYQGQVFYPGNQGMVPGGHGGDMMSNPPPRGRGRGYRGGRGRGYQSQGRHKRFNENQVPSHMLDRNSANSTTTTEESNANEVTSVSQGAEGTGGGGEDKPALHFDETKDHYAGDEEEKNFAESVAPDKANTRKGYNNRGGRSYSRGTHRQRNNYNDKPADKNGNKSVDKDGPRDERGDMKVAQREARQKMAANHKRRQLPGSDEDDNEPPPPEEPTKNAARRSAQSNDDSVTQKSSVEIIPMLRWIHYKRIIYFLR